MTTKSVADNARTIMPNGRYTDRELELIKNTFAERIDLLKALRKHFLQLKMSDAEEVTLLSFRGNEDLMAVLRKAFLPEIDGDAPLWQIVDLWMITKIDEKSKDDAKVIINANRITIDYIDQQLKLLAGKKLKEIVKFSDFTNNMDLDIDFIRTALIARNTLASYFEKHLDELRGLAGLAGETAEETARKREQNSNK